MKIWYKSWLIFCPARVIVFLRNCFHFFSFLREFFSFLEVFCLKYLAKFIRKHPCWRPFFQWHCRIDLQLYLRLLHRCFLMNSHKKLHYRCLTGFQVGLRLWQVLVGKINHWKKIEKVINFNLETSEKNLLSYSKVYLEPSRTFMELFWENS